MQIMNATQAAALLDDGDTILVGGSGNGHAVPEKIMAAIEQRFLAEGHPRNITSIHPVGLATRRVGRRTLRP